MTDVWLKVILIVCFIRSNIVTDILTEVEWNEQMVTNGSVILFQNYMHFLTRFLLLISWRSLILNMKTDTVTGNAHLTKRIIYS